MKISKRAIPKNSIGNENILLYLTVKSVLFFSGGALTVVIAQEATSGSIHVCDMMCRVLIQLAAMWALDTKLLPVTYEEVPKLMNSVNKHFFKSQIFSTSRAFSNCFCNHPQRCHMIVNIVKV
jgi:hypothetical protein